MRIPSAPPIYAPIIDQNGQMSRPWVTWFSQVFSSLGGGLPYYGTFTANGATPVTVTNANYDSTSIVDFSLNTPGGIVGAYPTIQSGINGTSFDVVCTALDTSIYNYFIN